jgi:hypothetical protein
MKKKSLFILLLLLSSCGEPEYISYNTLKVEVIAPLIVNEVARVSLNRIFSIGESIDTLNLYYENALLILKENNQFYDSLRFDKNGRYYSIKKIRAGRTYILTGDIPGLPKFYSKEVTIPDQLPDIKLVVKKDTILDSFGQGLQFAQFEYSLSDNLKFNNQDLVLSFLVTFEDTTSGKTPSIFTSDITDRKINSCRTYAPFDILSLRGHIILDINCAIEQVKTIPFFVETNKWVFPDPDNFQNRKLVTASKVELSYGAVSKELFLYKKKNDLQPSDTDRLLTDPTVSYTNLVNAFGVVYGVNAEKLRVK